MPRRKSIAPENQIEQMFKDLKKSAKSGNTKPSGSKYISAGQSIVSENDDGTLTVIGGNGIQENVGDTTIPPVPAGITVKSVDGAIVVSWDGRLADHTETIPNDWSHLEIRSNGNRVGEIRGSQPGAMSFYAAVDQTITVQAYAVDKADNYSPASESVFYDVTSVTGGLTPELEQQLDDNTDAIEAAKLEIAEAKAKALEASNTANGIKSGNMVPDYAINKGAVWGDFFYIEAQGTGYAGLGSYYFVDSVNAAEFHAQYPAGKIAVEPGKKYQVSAMVRSNTAFPLTPQSQLVVRQYKVDNTFTTANIGRPVMGPANTWQEIKKDYTPPADIVALTIGYTVNANHQGDLRFSNPSVKLYVDDQISQGGIKAGQILLDADLDTALSNHLHPKLENITVTENANVNTLVANKIAAANIDVQKVRAENVTAGTGTFDTTVAGMMTAAQFNAGGINTTTSAFSGVKIQSTGITAWDGTTTPTFDLKANTGSVTIRKGILSVPTITGGTITAATIQTSTAANTGLKIDNAGLKLWATGNTTPVISMNADGSGADIDGSVLRAGTVDASKISLTGGTSNVIPGGDGSYVEGWTLFQRRLPVTGDPAGVKGVWITNGANPKTPSVRTSYGSKYTFSLKYKVNTTVNGASYPYNDTARFRANIIWVTQSAGLFITHYQDLIATKSWSSYTFPVPITNNDERFTHVLVEFAGDGNTALDVTDVRLDTEASTTLTPTGMVSSLGGYESIRLNGEDNFIRGEFATGRQGVDPTVKISSRTNTASIDFTGAQDGAKQHGAIWWNDGDSATNQPGFFNMWAIDDNGAGYQAGLELHGNGKIKFNGVLSASTSTFIKAGTWSPAALAAGSTLTYDFVFPTPYPAGSYLPHIMLTTISTAGQPLVATIMNRSTTGFKVSLKNVGTASSSTTRVSYVAIATDDGIAT